MNKKITVANLPMETPFYKWKQYLLYFDKIGYSDFNLTYEQKSDLIPLRSEVESLLKDELWIDTYADDQRIREFIGEYGSIAYGNLFQNFEEAINNSFPSKIIKDISNRLDTTFCNNDSRFFNHTFIPISNISPQNLENFALKKSQVVNIVIESMPLVHPDTPIEHIIEFKQNEENYNRFLRLRDWVNEMVNSNLPENEIKEKLEFHISEYERYMKLHRIKYKRSILKTILFATPEILENVAKFNFSGIGKTLFTISESNVDLLSAELEAPGRELSYIIKAQNDFNPK